MLARLAGAFAVLIVTGSPAWADAPALANGRAHFQGARFEEAERVFSSVVEEWSATRADLAEAYRYLAALRLLRGMPSDAEEAALKALSLDRALVPPQGAPPDAAALFDRLRERIPEGGLSCSLELPPRPVASAPVGVRIHVVGDPAGLVASASLTCGDRVQRVVPERGENGTALALTTVDGGPAGRREECVATLQSAANVVLARATGTFVPAEPVADPGDDVLAGAGRGRSHVGRDGGRFPWLWVGIGAGVVVVAGAIVTAVVLANEGEDAYVGRVVLTQD